MGEQLALLHVDRPSGLIAEHGLLVDVDAPVDVYSIRTAFVGEKRYHGPKPTALKGQFVHVISPARGGEIRGYVLIDGTLHLRLPAYNGVWPEMDDAVAAHLGARVLPYREASRGGWMEEAAHV